MKQNDHYSVATRGLKLHTVQAKARQPKLYTIGRETNTNRKDRGTPRAEKLRGDPVSPHG